MSYDVSKKKYLTIVIFLTGFILVGAFFYLLSVRDGEAKKRKRERVIAEQRERNDLEQAKSEMAKIQEERNRKEIWNSILEIKNTAIEKGGDYALAEKKLKEFKTLYPSNECSDMADREIASLDAAKKIAIEKLLLELENKARPLVEKEDFAAVVKIYADYSGPLMAETKIKREEIIEINSKMGEIAAQKAKTKEDALNATISIVVNKIIASDIVGALDALKKDADNNGDRKDVRELTQYFDELLSLDATLLTVLKSKQGDSITVTLNGKPEILTICEVGKDGKLLGEQKINKVSMTRKFSLENISKQEQMKLLDGNISETAKSFLLLLSFIKEKKWDEAEKHIPQNSIITETITAKIASLKELEETKVATPDESEDESDEKKTEEVALVPTVNEIFLDAKIAKTEKTRGGNVNEKTQNIKLKYFVENKSFKAAITDYSLDIMVIAESMSSAGVFKFLERKNIVLNIELRKKYEEEISMQTIFDDSKNAYHGFRYYAYLLVLRDTSQKIIKTETNKPVFLKIVDKLLNLKKGDNDNASNGLCFDVKSGEKVTSPR